MRQVRAGVLVGVRPMGDGIEVRFKWQGKTWRPRLRLPATKANVMHADRLRREVLQRIAQGTFSMDAASELRRLAGVEAELQQAREERTALLAEVEWLRALLNTTDEPPAVGSITELG